MQREQTHSQTISKLEGIISDRDDLIVRLQEQIRKLKLEVEREMMRVEEYRIVITNKNDFCVQQSNQIKQLLQKIEETEYQLNESSLRERYLKAELDKRKPKQKFEKDV